MKTFREHINEDVTLGSLTCGGISIDRDSVRDEINAILSGVSGHACVTPYGTLNKIRKALAYFHIHLPKKVYLEGKHGVEVWEVNQFGEKMGVNDQGEWISEVPNKYFLYMHYHLMGSMYYTDAKIVDEKELETRLTNIEKMVSEEMDAASRQGLAKAIAPKEDQHTALGDCDCSQGDSPSTKKAVKVSMKKIDEGQVTGPRSYKGSPDRKRKAVQMALGRKHKDHPDWNPRTNPQYSALKLGRKLQKQGVTEDKDPCWKGYEMVGMKKKGGRKVPNCVPVKEEQIDEISDETVKSHTKKVLEKLPKQIAKKNYGLGKERERAKDWLDKRNKGSVLKMKRELRSIKEEQIDEVSKKVLSSYIKKASDSRASNQADYGRFEKFKNEKKMGKAYRTVINRRTGIQRAADKLAKEETISEKAPPGAKFERMVKHIKKGYSKDGLTTKEKSIAYATAWKAKKRESKD